MRGASYKKGEIIFREGDPGNCMYDIFWGRVGVYTGYGTPQEKKLAELKTEDFFGEMVCWTERPVLPPSFPCRTTPIWGSSRRAISTNISRKSPRRSS